MLLIEFAIGIILTLIFGPASIRYVTLVVLGILFNPVTMFIMVIIFRLMRIL